MWQQCAIVMSVNIVKCQIVVCSQLSDDLKRKRISTSYSGVDALRNLGQMVVIYWLAANKM